MVLRRKQGEYGGCFERRVEMWSYKNNMCIP